MIRIKDMYVSLSNIKKIEFEGNGNFCYMFITYCYEDNNPIKIEVDNFGEYQEIADMIVEALK